MNNIPETARICRITHAPTAECSEPVLEFKPLARRSSSNASTFLGDVLEPATSLGSTSSASSNPSQQGAVVVVRGAAEILESLQQLNRDVRSREFVNGDEQVRSGHMQITNWSRPDQPTQLVRAAVGDVRCFNALASPECASSRRSVETRFPAKLTNPSAHVRNA